MTSVRYEHDRACAQCGSRDIWDRELALDADGNVTTPPAAVSFARSVICYTCKHDQGLGPANDEPCAVQVEIIAARWAVEFDRPSQAGPCPFGECDVCQARHLAEVIRDAKERTDG